MLSIRGDAQLKTGKNVNTKGAYERKIAELKSKIKKTNDSATHLDNDIRVLQENKKDLSSQLENKQTKVYELQGAVDEVDSKIDLLSDQRQRVSFSLCNYFN